MIKKNKRPEACKRKERSQAEREHIRPFRPIPFSSVTSLRPYDNTNFGFYFKTLIAWKTCAGTSVTISAPFSRALT